MKRVLEAWQHHLSVMVQMPTGTGKTHLLALLVEEELRPSNRKRKPYVWIVAHRRELVAQIEETVERYGIRAEGEAVRVMSIQWLSLHWEEVGKENPELIVIDEAHHALAKTYRELWLRYPHVKKLGVTATPCRLNGKGFTDLFETLVTSDSIADFISEGWLSAFDYVSIHPESEEQHLIDSLEKRGADGDYQVKEMNSVLNRLPSIGWLYDSMSRYANGKKGIVYAISIEHARNIAAYYNKKGVSTVALHSKTPSSRRKVLLNDFTEGKIQVLVNVDVFSEGFDCPKVEFVQMARPTLSLAKYLQQVGRGLRKAEGKETCMLIDNAGLYRLFGLPTAYRDWEAMFEGRIAGRGQPIRTRRKPRNPNSSIHKGHELEVVMTHNDLQEHLDREISLQNKVYLKAYKDMTSGLFGLKRGKVMTCPPKFEQVIDIQEDLALVKSTDKDMEVADEYGNLTTDLADYKSARFLKDKLLAVTDRMNKELYIDLYNGHLYKRKPKVLTMGGVQLLELNDTCYSRTKKLYKSLRGMRERNIFDYGYYVRIPDWYSPPQCRQINKEDELWGHNSVCLLSGDYDTYYSYCGMLPDGSIVVTDNDGKYYLAEAGKEKRYIACEQPKTEEEDFDTVITRLKTEAETLVAKRMAETLKAKEEKRKVRLAGLKAVVPFKSGMRWGLKSGNRVVVPPIYRNIKMPVGDYCAVESNPNQWGVIMLDGMAVVEARYTDVEINSNGTARLTLITGKTKTVDLKDTKEKRLSQNKV